MNLIAVLTKLSFASKLGWRWVVDHWKLALVGLVLAVILGLGLTCLAFRRQRDQARREKHDIEARYDTLKVVAADSQRVLYERLASYSDSTRSLRDQLKKAGKTTTVTKVIVRPVPVNVNHGGVPADSSSTAGDTLRVAVHDSVVGPPVDVRADIFLRFVPPRLTDARWAWSVRPRPLTLSVDVGCRGPNDPDVIVSAPPWATVDSVASRVSASVCPTVSLAASRTRGILGGMALGAAIEAGLYLILHR